MSETTIHGIKSITAFKIQNKYLDEAYFVRYLKIETESGDKFDLTLFSDDSAAINIVEAEEER